MRWWQLSGIVDGQERIQRLELHLEQDRHGINRLSRRLAPGPNGIGRESIIAPAYAGEFELHRT